MHIPFSFKKRFAHKKILIVGLGIQGGGVSVAQFFAQCGNRVRVTDLKTKQQLASSVKKLEPFPTITFTLGTHRLEDVDWADVVVQNPGVPSHSAIMAYAQDNDKQVVMETALFLKYCPARTVGITGTRGKSTTTRLIYEVAKKYLPRGVYCAGNIPHQPALSLLPIVKKEDIVILELSSWQLRGCAKERVSPNIAVLTNIYPDHLNTYRTMNEYINDKLNITRFQHKEDVFITLETTLQVIKNFDYQSKASLLSVPENYFTKPLKLPGSHNRENAALALKSAQQLGINTQKAEKVVSDFHGLPFRLEYLGEVKGAPFYNDSTSTTPTATEKAIEALIERYGAKKNIVLILGGNTKNLPYQRLVKLISRHVKHVLLLPGTFTTEIAPHLNKKLVRGAAHDTLAHLFNELAHYLHNEYVILFSPGATSFANFTNEFDRGEQFNQQFQQLQTHE